MIRYFHEARATGPQSRARVGRTIATWLLPVALLGHVLPMTAFAASATAAAASAPLHGDGQARSTPMPALVPLPSWVTPATAALDKTMPASAGGVDYLLIDHQVRVTAQGARTAFRHRVERIRNASGLDEAGQIEVDFNPLYQTLQIHQLRIHRAGQALPWQQRTRARWLDREPQLEQRIYDGTRTLSLTLDDLRVGDVLEFSYSISGWNPVFGGRQFGGFDLGWQVPVARAQARLLMPAGREPVIQGPAGQAYRIRQLAGEQEWTWDVQDTPALRLDSDVPAWFDPYPRVAWSEFKDWGDVARWAAPMYRTDATPPAALRQEIDQLTQRHASMEGRIAGALRLVQERVRYLSVSIGAGTHAPRRPEEVLAQRFGDCKDKSLLTVALLRGLGVEAQVALVNTSLRTHLDEEQPSGGAFDHAIVHARWNGHDYWLDPTRATQRGPLDEIAQGDFGRALLIDEGTTALTPITTAAASVDRREMEVDFDLSQGLAAPSGYKVTTHYFGRAAERMRGEYGHGGSRAGELDRLQKLYLSYYARSFDDLKVTVPLQWIDDEEANSITTVEHYAIGSLWHLDKAGKPLDAQLATPDMDAYFSRPDFTERQHPLRVRHPEQLDIRLTARLPASWASSRKHAPNTIKVEDEAFTFQRTAVLDGRTLTVDQQVKTLASSVAASRMPEYLQHLREADQWSGYRLKWSPRSVGSATSAPVSDTGLLVALLGIGLCLGAFIELAERVEELPRRIQAYPEDIAHPGWRRRKRALIVRRFFFALTLWTCVGCVVMWTLRMPDIAIVPIVYAFSAVTLGTVLMRGLYRLRREGARYIATREYGEAGYPEVLWRMGEGPKEPPAVRVACVARVLGGQPLAPPPAAVNPPACAQ